MKQLTTEWGRRLKKDCVKPEYPRPGLVRNSYLNLNGLWSCHISNSESCDAYDRTILVPFSPEASLSGVGVVVQPDQVLHYRKRFTLPDGFHRGRVLLHFGAVDQQCVAFLNGQALGEHMGGYLPFTFDITDSLTQGENTLDVRVRDLTEHAPSPRGKQKLVKKGRYSSIFYTPQSGIWKTVWLESVPETYITSLRFTPQYDAAGVEAFINANVPGQANVTITFQGTTVFDGTLSTGEKHFIQLPGFHPWTPDKPNLYDVAITLGDDAVTSYFGMRIFEKAKDPKGIFRFYLNKKPFFFNGLLDQGYWPDGLLTAPCEEALIHDIQTAKALGYNTLRKHVKVEEERFYYLCDRMGMVVWQDMPNGGGEYNMFFVTYLPNASDRFARSVKDSHYGFFKRTDQDGREQFYRELETMVSLLYNHPCIALWTPFNEGWGQFDAKKATARIRALDAGRLINEACGWFDQGGGDVFSIHNYIHRLKTRPRPPRVTAVTEYGGYAFPVPGHLACEKEFGYKVFSSKEALTNSYIRLWETEIFPNLEHGLSATIYTQLSDIEEEINGVITYDREVVKVEEGTLKALHQKLYDTFERLTE